MNWYKNLYLGEEARKKKTKIINQLEKHSISFGVYVITLASNGKDLLDVLPAFMLYRDHTRDWEPWFRQHFPISSNRSSMQQFL